MDPKFVAQMKALLEQVYEAGRQAGNAETLAAILAAAKAPQTRGRLPAANGDAAPKAEGARAPRGLLRETLENILTDQPGMTEQEIAAEVERLGNGVSPRSVGGQLRRHRNTLYRQQGRKWFLAGGDSATAEAVAELLT